VSEVSKIVNIPENDSFYDYFLQAIDEPVYSSDVYIDPPSSVGRTNDNFGAKVCINGVIFNATISGQIHV